MSGSVMAGNMTQGAIQATAAARLGVPVTSMLAVQVAGACAGKMVCVSSILVSPAAAHPVKWHSCSYIHGLPCCNDGIMLLLGTHPVVESRSMHKSHNSHFSKG